MTLLSVRICSVQDCPLQKLACSCLIQLSASAFSLFRITEQKTVPGTDSRVMPLQFPQLLKSPFYGSLIMAPCLHSSGTSSVVQIRLNSLVSSGMVTSLPCLSSSAAISSTPGDLLFLRVLIALSTSASSIASFVTITCAVGVTSLLNSNRGSGDGWFRTSIKWSIYL